MLTPEEILQIMNASHVQGATADEHAVAYGEAIESAATAPLLARIAELEALAESEGSRAVEYLRRARAAEAKLAQRVPEKITEEMHVAAVKVLHRASGVDGLPQRMLDAMLSAAPAAPEKAPNAQQAEPPPWWPAVENILNEYGLQAVDFVADFKAAQQAEAQEPCQSMCETPCTKRKPLTIAEVEAILARWSYELHGDRARFIVRETELAHGIGAAAAMAPEEAR